MTDELPVTQKKVITYEHMKSMEQVGKTLERTSEKLGHFVEKTKGNFKPS